MKKTNYTSPWRPLVGDILGAVVIRVLVLVLLIELVLVVVLVVVVWNVFRPSIALWGTFCPCIQPSFRLMGEGQRLSVCINMINRRWLSMMYTTATRFHDFQREMFTLNMCFINFLTKLLFIYLCFRTVHYEIRKKCRNPSIQIFTCRNCFKPVLFIYWRNK